MRNPVYAKDEIQTTFIIILNKHHFSSTATKATLTPTTKATKASMVTKNITKTTQTTERSLPVRVARNGDMLRRTNLLYEGVVLFLVILGATVSRDLLYNLQRFVEAGFPVTLVVSAHCDRLDYVKGHESHFTTAFGHLKVARRVFPVMDYESLLIRANVWAGT